MSFGAPVGQWRELAFSVSVGVIGGAAEGQVWEASRKRWPGAGSRAGPKASHLLCVQVGGTWGLRPPPPWAAAAQLLPPPAHPSTSSGAGGSGFHSPLWLPHRAPGPGDTQNLEAACMPVRSEAPLAATPAGHRKHGDVSDSARQPGRECLAFKEKLICN